jgi:hypothetical protein
MSGRSPASPFSFELLLVPPTNSRATAWGPYPCLDPSWRALHHRCEPKPVFSGRRGHSGRGWMQHRRELAWSFASQHLTCFAAEDRVQRASHVSAGRGSRQAERVGRSAELLTAADAKRVLAGARGIARASNPPVPRHGELARALPRVAPLVRRSTRSRSRSSSSARRSRVLPA